MPQLSRRFVAHISGPLTHPGLGQPWPCGCGKTDNAADAATCQGCGRSWSSSPMAEEAAVQRTADAVLFAQGHVLLIMRRWDPFAGCWALPGGYADDGEEEVDAAARELEEETSIIVLAGDLHEVGTFDAPGRDPRGHFVTTAFTVTLPSLLSPTARDDAAAARWWPLDALPDLAFDHAAIISAAWQQQSQASQR